MILEGNVKRTLIAVLAAALLAAMLTVASAATKSNVVKPGEDFVYLDKADVLSEATKGEIYFANRQLYEQTGAMIVVVAMDSLGGAETYDYAYDLYNSWGIGGKDNNGLLLLMAVEEDDYYALPGEGFEGVFSSSVLKSMMDKDLEPDFAKQNYDAGARKFFESAYKRLANYYNLDATIDDAKNAYAQYRANAAAKQSMNDDNEFADRATRTAPKAQTQRQSSGSGAMIWILLILIVVLIVCSRSKRRGGSFWFWRPTFFWPVFGPRRYPPNWQSPRPPRNPGPGGFDGPTTPGGFTGNTFGGTRTGGFTGSTGGFGGTRTGGFTSGRTFGSTRTFGGTRTGGFTGSSGSTRSSGSTGGFTRSSGSTSSRSTSRSFGGFTGKLGGFGGGFSGGGGRSFGGGAGRGRH